ncbi:hypothetical protein TNCV_5030431 [Trichonephila clavipes]|nr:hypothetical protein TNCV_5030431 [Trichonephila clavipes]
MSQQYDLTESMAWRFIGRLESGKHRTKRMLLGWQDRFQITSHVRGQPVQGLSTCYHSKYDQLTARPDRTANAMQIQRQFLLVTR